MVQCTALRNTTSRSRTMRLLLSLILLPGLFFVPHQLATAEKGTGSAFHATDLAVIRFASPRQFALLLHEPEPAPRLYKIGDFLVHPGDTARLLEVERIGNNNLVLREPGTERRWSLRSNRAAPVWNGLFFLGTVSLTEIQYRFEVSDKILRGAPMVLSMAESRAVLIQQVPSIRPEGPPVRSSGASPAAPGRRGDRATAVAIAPRRIDENTYEIDKSALAPTVSKLSEKIAKGLRGITQALLTRGPMLPVQSSLGEGVLTSSGFTVTQPKVAQTFGIEVGDTIVSLNGKPVSSPLNAWWTFQKIFIRDQTSTIRVDLVRGGKPIAKTYRFK